MTDSKLTEEDRAKLVMAVQFSSNGQHQHALPILHDLAKRYPTAWEPQHNLAVIRYSQGQFRTALHHARLATEYKDGVATWVQRALCHQGCNEAKHAQTALARVWERAPHMTTDEAWDVVQAHAAIHHELSPILPGLESRWAIPSVRNAYGWPWKTTIWRGGHLEGPPESTTLLVLDEQGAGDVIQFARWLPWVRESSGARVILRCRNASLTPLLAPLVDEVVDVAGSLTCEPTAVVPIGSLAYLACGPDAGTIDGAPYLGAGGDPVPATNRVAVCWAGNPKHGFDLRRSIAWDTFRDTLMAAWDRDVEWVNLTADARGVVHFPGMVNARAMVRDYRDTAAILATCAACVTVDTSVLHLAGALGVPTIGLVYSPSEWRWAGTDERTPWYETVQLARQYPCGDWRYALARARLMLQQTLWPSTV